MKKLFTVFLSIFMVTFFVACTSSGNSSTENSNNSSNSTASTTESKADISDSSSDVQASSQPTNSEIDTGKKILVAYFSATGTTKAIAEKAANAMKADLYEITPAEPYSAADLNYNTDCRANREMNDPDCRPAISGSVENMESYDIIFIGYPIWWGEAPRIVSTFVESYDFSGKTVVTFSTSGGSGHNDNSIKSIVSGANWITGTRINSGASQSDVANWIGGLGLDITLG